MILGLPSGMGITTFNTFSAVGLLFRVLLVVVGYDFSLG